MRHRRQAKASSQSIRARSCHTLVAPGGCQAIIHRGRMCDNMPRGAALKSPIWVRGGRSAAPPDGKVRNSLLDEGAHPLAIVRVETGLALQVALEIELGVEVVALRRLERALEQAETELR